MAVQMTRAEYEAKYGVAPNAPPVNVSGIDTNPSVPKMTSAEYEVKYGVQPGQKRTLANLTINKYGLDEKPEYFGNPAETIRGAGEQVESAISGTGQFTGKGAGERGFAAASSAFLAVPSVVADVIPGGKKALEAISKTFEGGINIAGGIGYTLADTARSLGLMNDKQREAYDTRATNFAKTVSSTPLGVALESSANILKYAGDVANVLLMADGVARGTDNYLKNELPKQQAEAKTKIQKIQEQKQVLEVQKVADEIAAVESRYAKGRKANLYSKDAGLESRQRIASTGVLQGAVNKDGIVQTRGKGGAVEKYEAMTTKPAEGVVRLNLAKEGGKTKLSVVEAGLREQVMKSGLEGADLTAALNGVKKEIAGLRLKAENGYVPNTLLHDAKINTTKNINYQTPPETATYRKAIARGYKNLVEQNSNLPIKEINSELGKFYEDIARLESLDGMRVMGGKLGKYTAQISGNIAGATVGSLFGPLGMVVGTVVGGEVSSALKGGALARSFKGSGGQTPSSQVLNQAISDANAPRLALPPNTSGFRSVRPSGEPIQLPARSQSAIDAKQVGATKLQVALSEAFSARGEGITISIRGDKPTSGFVYAPSKTTEFSVPAESFTRATLEEYVNKYYNEYQKPGNYIGLWPDEGKIYMDISRVVPDESQAVKGAIESNQIAIYDIGTGNTKYTRDYGYSDGSYIYRGKDKGAGDNGTGGTGNSSGSVEPTAIKLSPEERAIETKAIAKYQADPNGMVDEYISKYGNVANADLARREFKDVGYNGLNSASVHEPASALAKAVWRELLARNKWEEAYLFSGGSGAGKSTAVNNLPEIKNKVLGASAIYDSNLSKIDTARQRIQEARDAGKNPVVLFVYREPVDAWVNGVVKRMRDNVQEGGRTVPLSEFLKNTEGSLKTTKQLIADGVQYGLLDNSLGKGKTGYMSLDKLYELEYNIPILEQTLRRETKKLYDTGQITKEQYNSLLQ